MSYIEARVPISDISKMSIYVNRCQKSMSEVQGILGCDYIINAGMWNPDGSPCEFLWVNGVQMHKSVNFNNWGYSWNKEDGSDIRMDISNNINDSSNFISVVPLLTPWDGMSSKLSYPSGMGGVRGRSAIGLTKDGGLFLYCSKDGSSHSKSPEALRKYMYENGCVTAMMLDGGGSSQGSFRGSTITASRRVHNFICIWTKTMPSKKEPDSKQGQYLLNIKEYKLGDKGETVWALQRLLLSYGYNLGNCGSDGSFGPATKGAVMKYQRDNGIQESGRIDRATFCSLLRIS